MNKPRPLGDDIELAFFRQLWDNSSDPFWLCEVVGDDFVFVAFNPAEALIDARFRPGVLLRDIVGHGTQADMLMAGYFTCRDRAETLTFEQRPVIDGQQMLFQTLLVPVRNTQGVVTHIWGSARNLTNFLQAQIALEALNAQLEQRVAERTAALICANDELQQANQALKKMALQDGLTGLNNRSHFFLLAAGEVSRSSRHARPLSLLMLDVDHFKRINDQCGHATGDEALRQLAALMSRNLRQHDVAARIGGEEFVILLPETRLPEAAVYAQRLCSLIAAANLTGNHVTVSIGVAQMLAGESHVQEVMIRADLAMYRAKAMGRNRVEIDGQAAQTLRCNG